MTISRDQVISILNDANTARFTPKTGPTGGCGRAYVCLSTTDKDVIRVVASAAEVLDLKFERKGFYGTGKNAFYIGYDNADGRALAKSEAFAQVLNESRFECLKAYTDAVGD